MTETTKNIDGWEVRIAEVGRYQGERRVNTTFRHGTFVYSYTGRYTDDEQVDVEALLEYAKNQKAARG